MCRKNFIILKKKSKILTTKKLYKTIKLYKTKVSYCLKCRKNTEIKNPKVVRTKSTRIMLFSKCSVSNKKDRNFLEKKKLQYY